MDRVTELRIAELLNRIDYLEEANRQLNERLTAETGAGELWIGVKRLLGVQKKEARLLAVLMHKSPRPVLKEALVAAIECSNQKHVDVYLCRLRGSLRGAGVDAAIATIWGVGVALAAKDRDAILRALDAAGLS